MRLCDFGILEGDPPVLWPVGSSLLSPHSWSVSLTGISALSLKASESASISPALTPDLSSYISRMDFSSRLVYPTSFIST